MALRFLHRSEIRGHFLRLHHHLSKEQDPRAHNLGNQAHQPYNRVHFRQVAAARPQLLPDVGHRVNPDNIHPLIGQVQEIIHHLIKYPGIPVV